MPKMDLIIEEAIRKELKKPGGKPTKADLESVTRLGLVSTKISDASLKELPKLKGLKLLYLSGTEISNAGLKNLSKLKQLTELTLINTKVTLAGVEELQKVLPDCRIYSNATK